VGEREKRFNSMLCCGGLKVSVLTHSLSSVVMMLNFSELNKLVKKLDCRIAKSPQQGTMQPKKRIASTPSTSEAPAV
jgi:hypothetical protein